MSSIKAEALSRGVHPECFTAGPDASCPECYRIVMDIYAERYDDVPLGPNGELSDIRTAIRNDGG